MTCGIYAIVCDKTWRSYVGQSTNLENRKRQHLGDLKNQVSINIELQNDFNLYGEDSFYFEILEETFPHNLGIREKYWIEFGCNLYNKVTPPIILFLSNKDKERFYSKIDIGSKDECWDWNGGKNKSGYGGFRLKDKTVKPHRIVYFDNNPESDPFALVRHKCNNRLCCNPNHLTHGNYKDNAEDRCGNKLNYKITQEEVKLIRSKFCENPDISGDEFRDWFLQNCGKTIDKRHILRICFNKSFFDKDYIPPKRNTNKIKPDMLERIKELISQKLSSEKIKEKFKIEFNFTIARQTIDDIRSGKIHKGE